MDEYVERVSAKASNLEHSEIVTRQEISRTKQELARTSADITLERAALVQELALLEQEVHSSVARIKDAVGQFKSVIKKGDLVRLQNRIDAWAPEKKITKSQFAALLADEFSG